MSKDEFAPMDKTERKGWPWWAKLLLWLLIIGAVRFIIMGVFAVID